MDTQIISLSNQKGGVGKTTTCANLGIGLAREGKRVLLVDCDPQASLTLSLGWRKPETLPVTLATLMGRVLQKQPVHAEEAILHHAEGVDLIPGSIALNCEVKLYPLNAELRLWKNGWTCLKNTRKTKRCSASMSK